MNRYFGAKLAGSMFPTGRLSLKKEDLTPAEAREFAGSEGVIFSFGSHYRATLQAVELIHQIEIPTQEEPPKFVLRAGDSLVLLQVSNLPPLEGTFSAYTREQALRAQFRFTKFTLLDVHPLES